MPKKATTSKSYRQLSAELADIMAWFESGDVDLDEALNNYKKAMGLIDELERYLKHAENQVTKLAKDFSTEEG